MFKSAVLCAALAMGSVDGASAATLSFNNATNQNGGVYVDQGFSLDDARIGPGNCVPVLFGDPCLKLNVNETTTITRFGGGTFSLLSFWFELVGEGSRQLGMNTLTVTGEAPTFTVDLASGVYGNNDGGQVITFMSGFSNITSLVFSHSGGGNVRIDDIALTVPAAVPVPAAAGLLALALGGLGLAGRRKKA